MVTPVLALATLPATTTTLQAGIRDRLHHIIQVIFIYNSQLWNSPNFSESLDCLHSSEW